jgi:hypothetical protein
MSDADPDETDRQLEKLAGLDKTRQAPGAHAHGYSFASGAERDSWLAANAGWLEREIGIFETIENLFGLCATLEDFETGFRIRVVDTPYAARLTSYLNLKVPDSVPILQADPQPMTVDYRWLEEQYRRYRARYKFSGGMGKLLSVLPRSGRKRKG